MESQQNNSPTTNAVEKQHVDGTVDLVLANALGGEVQDLPEGYFRSAYFIGTVLATCTASISAYLGWVLPANTLSLIAADLGPSGGVSINWVSTAWTLGSGIGFLLVGRLSDIFGRRGMVLGCNTLSIVGCVLAATAGSVGQLVAASLLNGIAAAGQLSHGIVLGELVPARWRGPVASIVFLSSAPFSVFGPVIARLFILRTAQGWRWSFYLGIILSVVTVLLYALFYHPPRYSQLHVGGRTRREQLWNLDFGGLFLWVAGMTLFLVGLSWGGTTYPWNSAPVLATLIMGILTLIAFGLYEHYVIKGKGLIPPRLFNIEFTALVVIATLASMVYYSMTVLWPTLLSTVFKSDVMQVGWQSSVVGGGVLLGQAIGGFTISYLPRVKFQAIVASIFAAAFVASLAGIRPDLEAGVIVLGIVATVNIGIIENISLPGVTLLFDACDIGLASGALGSIRAMGGAVAQPLYISILNNEMARLISTRIGPAAVQAGLPESSLTSLFTSVTTGDFSEVPGMTNDIASVVSLELQNSYVSSFRVVFLATIPFGVLLIIFACLVPNMESYLGGNVARRLQNKEDREGSLSQEEEAVDNPKS